MGVLAVFDVRGVLSENGRGEELFLDPVLKANIEVIQRIQSERKDFFPVILSGGTWPTMKRVIRMLGSPFAGICEGAVIVTKEGLILEKNPLKDWHLVKSLLTHSENAGILEKGVMDYWPLDLDFHRFYFGLQNHDIIRYLEKERHLLNPHYLYGWTEFPRKLEDDISLGKVTHFLVRTHEKLWVPEGLRTIHERGVKHFVRSGNIDKAFGLRRLVACVSRFASYADIWYFGDSENDQPVADMDDLEVNFVAVGSWIRDGRNVVDRVRVPGDLGSYLINLFL